MSESLVPHHQHISGVSTENHSQAFVGSARDVYFAGAHVPQETSEQAASACRNALFLTDPYIDRESLTSAKGARVAGTCEWITHNESYRAWLDGDTRLLWVSGGPGKGKTMLSIFLTEELERHTANTDDAELVFFFCSHQDEKRNTAVAVLRSLVYQIITKRLQLVRHALPYFETPEKTQQTLASLEALWIIFSKLVVDAEFGTIFCVLDGLDECEESTLRILLPRIVSLLAGGAPSSTKGTFKLAIVSRDIPRLQCCTRIRLDPDNDEKVVSDIELFVSTRVDELSRIEGFNNEFRASVQRALLARAEGTFLWVGFAMYELLQKQTCTEIWEALADLPSGLPATYSRMLLRIPVERREMSCVILRWVTMALRPLQLQELAAAVGVRAFSPSMTIEQATRDAIALCGVLLKVQEQEVSLVHQSARDYLLREERDRDAVLESFRFKPERAHLELARECLDCVAQSSLRHRIVDLNAKLCSQESPLLRYAALHWPEHAKSCFAQAAKLFDPAKLFFQKKSSLRGNWWVSYRTTKIVYCPELPSLLNMACFLGILPWIEAILAKKSWRPRYHKCVDKKDGEEMTVLHWAARRGNEVVVQLLIERGADVKAKDMYGETVLHLAALGGNDVVVQLLIDKGADIKAKDKDGKTVLHLAALGGNEVVVQLLVDRGADIKAKDKNGRTVLHLAALEGNEVIVQLLVDRGADIKAKDMYGETVLHFAALGGNEVIVQLLVDRGADIKAKDKDGETVLHSAALGGSEVIARLLVDIGADIKAKDKNGETVLHLAAFRGNKAAVQLLVDRGADIKAKDKNGETVLHLAAFKGNKAAVQLLVDRGADIKAKDMHGRAVLHSAALGGNEVIVQLLVDRGADVKAKDKNGETALHLAAIRGNGGVVQLLEASLAS